MAVLANDQDPDGDQLSVVQITQPANGVATVGGDNVVHYTPRPFFAGTDTFTYTAVDGQGGVTTGVVTIHVDGAATVPDVDTPGAMVLVIGADARGSVFRLEETLSGSFRVVIDGAEPR